MDLTKRAKNRIMSKIRARRRARACAVKRLWGFTKVQYRSLVNNATRALTALALANSYLAPQLLDIS
jgi:hypothetical protein